VYKYNQYPGQKSWSFRFRKTTSGEAFLYPGIKISLLFMLPAPQHAPPAYNWLPGNIHDLNMIRKVVPRCIEITTLVYPIAVDISSLQKCDLIHHFPDRHGWASFAMPFCQFAGFEIPMPFLLPKEELDFCRCNKYRPRVSKRCGEKQHRSVFCQN
jgi:hypothetical protein